MSQIDSIQDTTRVLGVRSERRVVVHATGSVRKLDFVPPAELRSAPPEAPHDVELLAMRAEVAVRGQLSGDASVEVFFWIRPDGSAFTIGSGVFEGEVLDYGKGSIPYELMGEFEDAYFAVGVEAVHFGIGTGDLEAVAGGMLVSRHQVRDGQPTGQASGWLGILS